MLYCLYFCDTKKVQIILIEIKLEEIQNSLFHLIFTDYFSRNYVKKNFVNSFIYW